MFRELVEKNIAEIRLMAEATMMMNEKYYDKLTRYYYNGVFQKPEIKKHLMMVMEEFRMFGGVYDGKTGMEGMRFKKVEMDSNLVNDMAYDIHILAPDIEVSYELKYIIEKLYNVWMRNWILCGIEICKMLDMMSGEYAVKESKDGKEVVVEKLN